MINLILASFSSIMSNVGYIVIALAVLLLMITIHEFGHYSAGKLLGFKVNEFAIGFGKAIYKKKNKKTGEIFSVRLLPLGGYCAFAGEDEDNKDENAFNNKKPWKRIIVLLAGVFFNYLTALIFSVILLAVVGNPLSSQKLVMDETSANYGLLQTNDIVTAVNDREISYWDFTSQFGAQISDFTAGEEFTLTVERNGESIDVLVSKYRIDEFGNTIEDDSTLEGARDVIGITSFSPIPQSFFSALGNAFPFSIALCWMVLQTLGLLITGGLAISDIGGPITTISTIATVSSYGLKNLLYIIPLIAANLAVFNTLPVPALDGARVVFTSIEWIRGKPINRNIEATIHLVGLIVLFAFVIIVDAMHLFI